MDSIRGTFATYMGKCVSLWGFQFLFSIPGQRLKNDTIRSSKRASRVSLSSGHRYGHATRVRHLLIVTTTLLACLALLSVPPQTWGDDSLKAGAAVRVVNPTRPAVTIGHRVTKRFTNVYADLRVQSMVIEDIDGRRIVWMGMDFCVLRHRVVDHIKREIENAYGIKSEWVCINASHTHSAPPLTEDLAVLPEHLDQKYSDRVLTEAVAVVGDAIQRLQPAHVRYAQDRCQVGINRRLMRDGKLQFIPNPEGVVDHRVQVVAARSRETEKLIGVAVKYACHPVTIVGLGLGSDYPGYMRKIVEQRHPGAVAVFLQGCGADVRIRAVNEDVTDWVDGDFAMAERFGTELADAVERTLDKTSAQAVEVTGPVWAAYQQVQLPVKRLENTVYQEAAKQNDTFSGNWGRRFSKLISAGKPIPQSIPYRLQTFRLGTTEAGLTVVALDGEVFTEYGLKLERALARGPFIALGYSNGVVTYIPTDKALAEGGYETTAFRYFLVPGPFRQGVEQQVLDGAIRVAGQLGR